MAKKLYASDLVNEEELQWQRLLGDWSSAACFWAQCSPVGLKVISPSPGANVCSSKEHCCIRHHKVLQASSFTTFNCPNTDLVFQMIHSNSTFKTKHSNFYLVFCHFGALVATCADSQQQNKSESFNFMFAGVVLHSAPLPTPSTSFLPSFFLI